MSENIKHLRSILEKMTIEDTTEAIEFLEAIEKEFGLSENDNYEDILSERDKLQERVSDLEEQLEESINSDELVEIDCGIGIINVQYPDNIKLQGIVDDFKSVLEKRVLFGSGV